MGTAAQVVYPGLEFAPLHMLELKREVGTRCHNEARPLPWVVYSLEASPVPYR